MSGHQSSLRALCTEPENYSEAGLKAIRAIASLDARPIGSDDLGAIVADYDLLFIRLKTFVDAAVLDRADRLRAIVTPTTGLNHLDLEAAAAKGVEVFHLKGQVDFLRTVTSTAEHTWALLLSLYRRIPAATADVLAGNWRQDPHRGHELHGKRLGILGFGRLGRIVAEYGRAFGMTVQAYDHRFENPPDFIEIAESQEELLGKSDVLSVHVPLNPDTHRLIGRREFGLLPAGAVVVNTSRGEVLDEKALIDALASGHLAGAAVDVIDREKSASANALVEFARSHPNVIITPHIAGATFEAVEKTDLFVIGHLRNWLDQQG